MLPSHHDIQYLNETVNDMYIIKQVKKQNKIIQIVLCLLLCTVIAGFVMIIFF